MASAVSITPALEMASSSSSQARDAADTDAATDASDGDQPLLTLDWGMRGRSLW